MTLFLLPVGFPDPGTMYVMILVKKEPREMTLPTGGNEYSVSPSSEQGQPRVEMSLSLFPWVVLEDGTQLGYLVTGQCS
jgi:hypothetical protein